MCIQSTSMHNPFAVHVFEGRTKLYKIAPNCSLRNEQMLSLAMGYELS